MYSIYLKYLRYRIKSCNTVDDIVSLLKNINFFHKDTTSDKICDILIKCFNIYPITNEELQKFSIFEQQYNNEYGIYNYATFILWTSIIISIQENIFIDNSNNFININNNIDNNIIYNILNNYIINPIYFIGTTPIIKIINLFNVKLINMNNNENNK